MSKSECVEYDYLYDEHNELYGFDVNNQITKFNIWEKQTKQHKPGCNQKWKQQSMSYCWQGKTYLYFNRYPSYYNQPKKTLLNLLKFKYYDPEYIDIDGYEIHC